MAQNDPTADALSKLNNAVSALYKKVVLKRSKFLTNILDVLEENNYIGSYEIEEDGKQGLVHINLIGTINKCGVVKPRYPVSVSELEKYERKYLPAKDFGVLVLSTSQGMLTHRQAKEKNVGGVVVAYCY